ncbi:hypothetical protein SLE2022_393130 [Rubroshorea leprosula]
MSHQTQGPSPAEPPTKRRRGRPRKDETLVQEENSNIPAMAALDSAKKTKQSVSTSNAPNDDMVGQVVSGVIDGLFDAGYLLNVKVADTDTFLRGVVFLPGQFTPITAANDVAPHAKMYHRKEIPIPSLNPESQLHTAGPLLEKPVELKNDSAKLSGQVQPAELLSGISVAAVAGEKQSAAVKILPARNLPINDTGLSLGEKVSEQKNTQSALEKDKAIEEDQATGFSLGEKAMEQKTVESALEKDKAVEQDQVPPVIDTGLSLGEKVLEQKSMESSLEKDRAVGQDQVMQGFDTGLSLGENVLGQKKLESPLEKDVSIKQNQVLQGFETFKLEKGPNIDVELPKELGLPSIPYNDNLLGSEASNHQPQVEHQSLSSDLNSDVISSNFELNQMPLFTKPESEVCSSTGLDMLMEEKQSSPRQGTFQDTHLDLIKKVLGGADTSHINGIPLTDAVPTIEAGTYSAPVTSLPLMIFGAEPEHIPSDSSEPKPVANDSTLARMVEPQVFSSPIDVNTSSMDCNANDTIPPAQS